MLEHSVARGDLDALAPVGLAQFLLGRLEAVEAVPVREVDAAGLQQLDDRVLARIRGRGQAALGAILDEVGDRLQRPSCGR